jgi:hypothetical protein
MQTLKPFCKANHSPPEYCIRRLLSGILHQVSAAIWAALIFSAVTSCNYKGKGSPAINLLLHNLQSSDSTIRLRAINKLKELEPNLSDQLALVEAAADSFPEAQNEWQTIPAMLMEAGTKSKDYRLVPIIEKIFPKLDAAAKDHALNYLVAYEDRRAVELFVSLVLKYHDELPNIPSGVLKGNREMSEIAFPALLKLIDDEGHGYAVVLLLLENFQDSTLNPAAFKTYASAFVNKSAAIRKQLAEERKNFESVSKMWDDNEYLSFREHAGVYADLLRYFGGNEVIAELKEYLVLDDSKLKMFAVTSLLKLQQPVDKKYLEEGAADPESRNYLYNQLEKLNQEALYPRAWYSQAAFAEGDMVTWLLYPTELARKPDEIQLMQVVDVDSKSDDGIVQFYLYRFRSSDSSWRDEGWMAGVSGYYKKAEQPSTDASGYTFSTFEKWDSKTPEEHVADIRKLIKDSNEKQKEEN